jgi:hypothetical protein
MTDEELYSKAQMRKRLKVGKLRYEYLIESGLLPEPIALTPGSRPVHTESQVQIYKQNIYRKAVSDWRPVGRRKTRPFSKKLISEIS